MATGPGTAIVVGGGIGGLAAALGLRRIGWSAVVLEQAPALAEVGAGLSLWPNATRSLDALGVGATARRRGVPAVSRGGFRLPSGKWLRHKRSDDVPVLMLHRADLHRTLAEALPDGWLRTGATVTGVEDAGDRVTVMYRTARGVRRETADLVVAADGVHSTVRTLGWPQRAVFDGRTAWRAVVDVPAGEEHLMLGPAQQFGVLPLPGDATYWFLTADAAAPDIRYDDELGEVRRRIAGWASPVPELLAATRAGSVLHHDILTLEPLPRYARGRTALLGDAAHAHSPDLGQGACQALEDAVVLAAALRSDPVPAALARYDALRRPRTQAIARAARAQADLTGLHPRAATLAVRLVPPFLWRRQAARWTTWAPPALPDR